MKDIKPFYIYTDKNSLYIKSINGQTEKLANNVHSYCATIDSACNIHICALDFKGKLNHFFKHNGYWKKKSIMKILDTTKNVRDMRLYSINNLFNIFIVEKYPISDNLHRLSHFNFDFSNYKMCKHVIDNILKDDEYFYKLDIDDSSNILLEYKPSSSTKRSSASLLFNNQSRQWSKPNAKNQDNTSKSIEDNNKTIKDDIFEYCYSLTYNK